MSRRSRPSSGGGPAGTLGAFGGVFTPSILTILGIIFYLRAGYVVGQVGLVHTLIIISLCYAISILTAFSLSAIATSMPVKGGGFYYVVSRTIGFEFGGALGLVLFISISTGIAFYAIGLGEVVVDTQFLPDWVVPTPRRGGDDPVPVLLRLGRGGRGGPPAICRHGDRLRLDPGDRVGRLDRLRSRPAAL